MILQKLRTALDRGLQRFLDKHYRDGYLETHVRTGIAHQIRALRVKAGLNQADFAVATGKKQSTVSRLENTDYGRVSVQTLLDVATAMNVALLVRFVDYSQFLRVTADMSERALAPENIFESQARTGQSEQAAILAKVFGDWGGLGEHSQQKVVEQRRQIRPIEHLKHPIYINQPLELSKWN